MDLPKSNSTSASFEPGYIIADSYQVVRPVYSSSTGQIYLCHRLENKDALVLMKVLETQNLDADLARHFRTEIAGLYSVDHPNVVQSYEYINKNGLLAYTMEYVPGGNLATVINPRRPLELDLIVSILRQLCAGLAAIHQVGIIHRDLKPENILLDENMHVKIANFSISREVTPSGKSGCIVGTIEYLSPEYLQDGIVAQSCDIYAFGVIAYELITSSLPFEGSSPFETMKLKTSHVPKSPHEIRSSCPIELSNLVMKALARHPAERYQSAKEILADLGRIAVTKEKPNTETAPNEATIASASSIIRTPSPNKPAFSATEEASEDATSASHPAIEPNTSRKPSFTKSSSSSLLRVLGSKITPDQVAEHYVKANITSSRHQDGLRRAGILIIVAFVIACGVFVAGRLYANAKVPSITTSSATMQTKTTAGKATKKPQSI